MRTGAIFARGSCRALKWLALFGVVFVLGAASAVAQDPTVASVAPADVHVTIEVGSEAVATGDSATVTVTVDAELPLVATGTAPSATTVVVTVQAESPAYDPASTDNTAITGAMGQTAELVRLGATPAEGGDYTILDAESYIDAQTVTVEIVLDPNTSATRSADRTGMADFQLLGRDADPDAEDEGLRLRVTGASWTGVDSAGDPLTADPTAVTFRTGSDPTTVEISDYLKIEDPQTQTYVLTLDPENRDVTRDPIMEGDTVPAIIKAVPPHSQGSNELTLSLDKPAPDYGFTITGGAALGSRGDSVTLGNHGFTFDPANPGTPRDVATDEENMAMISIETTDNDVNRTEDELTLSATYGVGMPPADTLLMKLQDLHVLPMVKAVLVDADGDDLNPQPMSVTERVDPYMLKLIVLDDEGMKAVTRFPEDLTVTLTQVAGMSQLRMADPQDDYSLGSTEITIPSGAVESSPVTLEVDLNDDLGDESLIFEGDVEGDAMYGTEVSEDQDVVSLIIEDATSVNVWVKDGATAVIDAALMAASPINPWENIFIPKSALFETATGYTVRITAEVSDPSVVDVFDGDDLTNNPDSEWPGQIVVNTDAPGTTTIILTGTAVSATSSAAIGRQRTVDIAEIEFDVTVELAVPPQVTGLGKDEGDGEVTLTWDRLHRRYEIMRYEWDQNADENWQPTDWTDSHTVTGLENGRDYTFRVRAVNAAGAGEAARIEATPMATPVDASQVVTVKSVSAATSVAESGGLEVTVVANVPAGTKEADGKVAPIASKRVMVSFPTTDIAAAEKAEASDTTLLGATNGGYTWEKITRTEKKSEQTYKFRVAIGQDLDAEDEKFLVEVMIDGASQKSKVVTIDDAQAQEYVLSLPSANKGAIAEGKSAKLTLEAKPKRTVDIPVNLALEPNDPSRYTLSDVNGMFGTTSFETTVTTMSDSDRADDTITVTAYSGGEGELGSLDITVTDANALPAVKATLVDKDGKALDPQPESVTEGETVMVMLTAVDKDGKAMKAAEKLTITLMPTGSADSADYRLSSQSIEIPKDKESSAAVDLMITEDQDIGEETLTFDAAVAGEAKNGTDKKSVAGVLSLMIMDGTQKLVWANSQEEVEAAVYAAKEAGAGDDMTFTAGEMIEVMGALLFSSAEGVSVSYTASSSMSDVASASVSGDTVMVTAMAEGMADITITAHGSMSSGVKRLDQSDPGMASVMFMVEVGLEALSITLAGPESMDLVEGMSAEVTATANRAVTADTKVMLMRDRAMSSAGDDDYMADPITITAGEMTGSTMVMAIEDNMMEDMEELVLYGMTEGMAGEVTGEVHLHLWDAAVPALPVIAQLLLAAFLAIGGYRRYRRR